MAQSYVTDVGTLTIPGGYATYKVQAANSGLAANGILIMFGEAESGPIYSDEEDLSLNAFGPDQLAAVAAKYKSGPLVDAFGVATAPANDPQIQGSFSRAILVKTNASVRASGALGAYGTLYDRSYGDLGNMIFYKTESNVAEVVPTTGSFTFIPPSADGSASTAKLLANGTTQTLSFSDGMSPADFQAAVDLLTGITATGGAIRPTPLAVAGTLALVNVGGNAVTITRSVDWATWATADVPVIGDTLTIPSTSVLCAAAAANEGAYVITNVTARVISATKLSDGTTLIGQAGVVTPPVDKSAAIGAVDDVKVYQPVVISLTAGAVIDGVGKSLEIAEDTASSAGVTDSIINCCYNLGTTTKVSWVSTTTTPVILTSAAELSSKLTVSRASDAVNEVLTAGGEIALKLSYYNASASAATLTITSTTLTTTVTGVVGADLSLTLANFPTISDLVAYINTSTGYSARVGTNVIGQISPTALDRVSAMGILGGKAAPSATTYGSLNGRVKIDAYRFYNKVGTSVLVQLGDPAERSAAGLPGTVAVTHLTGGARGATLAAGFAALFTALESLRGNFVIPLFSRDATEDKADGLTDSGSDYTISAIHAGTKTHVLSMSTLKRRRNRQAFLAFDGAFADQMEAAANVASFRCAMPFQNDKVLDSTGVVTQKGSWMAAVHAASMQAAAFYRPIFNKGINTGGFVQSNGDFNDQNDTNVEDALLAGLMPARRAPDGSWRWVSDQTTYGRDNNFVYNSIQAVYIADICAMTTAQRMEDQFVGQSVADISAPVALSYLEAVMADMLRLKIIAVSDDAPFGYKNASITISGGVMIVSVEIKLAGALYFVPISFLVSPVQQTAAQ